MMIPAPAPVPMPVLAPAMPQAHTYTPAPAGPSGNSGGSVKDAEELGAAAEAVRASARKALEVHERGLDHSAAVTSTLQGLKQRLVTEKISLEAAVGTAQANLAEGAGRLDAVLGEVAALHEAIRHLREQVSSLQANQVGVSEHLTRAQLERSALVQAVEQLRAQVAGGSASVVKGAMEVGAMGVELAHLRGADGEAGGQGRELRELEGEMQVLRGVHAVLQETR
ncbi:hypothetical protein B484DRAFT_206253 [Ochromonadaceae sp. CCMP2298]|nr:hypothetical protein B484DRAFT_206253 [Ochromonadaceae sp. CCMP2298]